MTPRESRATAMLDRALKRTGLMVASRTAFRAHAPAQSLLERVAFYLTPDLPHPGGGYFLDVVLRTAFAYREDAQQNGEVRRPALYCAFVAGLFLPLPALVEVMVTSQAQEWDPLAGQPLGRWLEPVPAAQVQLRTGELRERIVHMRPREIRGALAAILLTTADLNALPADALHDVIDYQLR